MIERRERAGEKVRRRDLEMEGEIRERDRERERCEGYIERE